MQPANVSYRNIIKGIQSLPPDALMEVEDFVAFLYARRAKNMTSSPPRTNGLKQELLAIGKRCAALPVLDSRSADEILGYNGQGLPE